MNILSGLKKAKGICIFNRREITELLQQDNSAELFKRADSVRKEFCGDEVHIRGIIEFSNYCCRNCLYCGLRSDNKNVHRYRMRIDEIVELANGIAQDGVHPVRNDTSRASVVANAEISNGVKTIVLQSGDDFGSRRNDICKIVERIKKNNPCIAITLSVGERPFDDYMAFRDSGADRYLIKHETSNPHLYEKLHPGQSLKKRIEILEFLKKIGFQIGSGFIVGLPQQTLDDLAGDILLLNDLNVDMAGLGPFIPNSQTPLANHHCGNVDLTLKVLAAARIATENVHLPVTTALATLAGENGLLKGFSAGCNVIMPDFTPDNYRKDYTIYDDKFRITLDLVHDVILKANRKIATDCGDSLKC